MNHPKSMIQLSGVHYRLKNSARTPGKPRLDPLYAAELPGVCALLTVLNQADGFRHSAFRVYCLVFGREWGNGSLS